MTDYTKLTDFASKDSLPTGNAAKIVKGTEIDDEFEAIETAIATKADLASPSFTGTPSLPTGTTGVTQSQSDDSTKLATTAYVDTAVSNVSLESLYPVGSIYMNASDNTNPGTLIGFGTWVAFGAGRVPVGIDSSDTDFDTAEETGGAKTHTLTENEMPSHNHNFNQTLRTSASTEGSRGYVSGGLLSPQLVTITDTGGDQPHNNLQPYIVVYMWKRTA